MPRPLRIEIPDGWYHVMNRGLRRHRIFLDEEDPRIFLDTLEEACNRFNVKLGAYCLMGNHYHLLVKTPNANLSRFMRHVNGVYTLRFNRKHGQDGPLFRGRFRALIVDADSYLLQVIRYIHLNPVEAKIVEDPGEYPWSSHGNFLKSRGVPNWLIVDELLRLFSSQRRQARKLYLSFIHQGSNPELVRFYKRKHLGWILGGEDFIDSMKQVVANQEMDGIEIPQSRKIRGEVLLERIVADVSIHFGVTRQELMRSRRGTLNQARNVAIYLARELSGLKLREVANYFGAISHRTVAVIHFKTKEKAGIDKSFGRLLKKMSRK